MQVMTNNKYLLSLKLMHCSPDSTQLKLWYMKKAKKWRALIVERFWRNCELWP